jgi:hypothetical protein
MSISQPITKERLKSYIKLKNEIESQKERLIRLRAELESPKSPNYDGMPHSNYAVDRLTESVANIDKLEWLIISKLNEQQTE